MTISCSNVHRVTLFKETLRRCWNRPACKAQSHSSLGVCALNLENSPPGGFTVTKNNYYFTLGAYQKLHGRSGEPILVWQAFPTVVPSRFKLKYLWQYKRWTQFSFFLFFFYMGMWICWIHLRIPSGLHVPRINIQSVSCDEGPSLTLQPPQVSLRTWYLF